MTNAETIRAYLSADATLNALLTGGIYDKDTLPAEGLSRKKQPAAYDASGLLRPCAVVAERAEVPFGLADGGLGVRAVSVTLEVYLYQAGNYIGIVAAARRIRDLLDQRRVSGLHVELVAETRFREQGMNDAAAIRTEYQLITIRSRT